MEDIDMELDSINSESDVMDMESDFGEMELTSTYPCALPTELVCLIAKCLDSTSICALRLTCRHMYVKSIHIFGVSHLHTLKTDLSPESLERMNVLIQNETLRFYPRRLAVFERRRNTPHPQLNYIQNQLTKEGALSLEGHHAVAPLSRNLERLTRCRTFQLLRISSSSSSILNTDEALAILQYVVAKEKLRGISFNLKCIKRGVMSMFDFPENTCLQMMLNKQELCAAWQYLRTLSFTTYSTKDDAFENWIIYMINHAPNLQELILTLHVRFVEYNNFFERMVPLLRIPNVQSLYLAGNLFAAPRSSLLSFLRMARHTLRCLTLVEIMMTENDGWVPILEALKNEFHSLTKIRLEALHWKKIENRLVFVIDNYHCEPDSTSAERRILEGVTFVKFDRASSINYGVRYEGPNVTAVLGLLVKCAKYKFGPESPI